MTIMNRKKAISAEIEEYLQSQELVIEDNNVVIKSQKINSYTQESGEESNIIPKASSVRPGIMPQESFDQLAQNTNDIAILKGANKREATYTALPDTLTSEDVNDIWELEVGRPAVDGDTLVSFNASTLSFAWSFFSSSSTWHFRGIDTLTKATNTGVLGAVTGSDTNGKIFVENDGSMSLKGYDTLLTSITDKLSKISQTYKIYGTDSSGNQTSYSLYSNPSVSSIPFRDSYARIKAAAGAADDDVVNLLQMNTAITNVSKYVTLDSLSSLNISPEIGTTVFHYGSGDIGNGYPTDGFYGIIETSRPTTSGYIQKAYSYSATNSLNINKMWIRSQKDASGWTEWSDISTAGNTPNTFSTFLIDSEEEIVADETNDVLNVNSGNGITLTTNPNTDSLTIDTSEDLDNFATKIQSDTKKYSELVNGDYIIGYNHISSISGKFVTINLESGDWINLDGYNLTHSENFEGGFNSSYVSSDMSTSEIDSCFTFEVQRQTPQDLIDVKKEIFDNISNQVVNITHPPGTIYKNKLDDMDPNTHWPGTVWEKIEEKFLFGASVNYPIGTTGGEARVTLTTANLPNHNHNVSIAGSGTLTTSNNTHNHNSFAKIRGLGSGSFDIRENVSSSGADESKTTSSDTHNHTVGSHGHTVSQTSVGSNESHNNMPPFEVVNIWARVN